jgi:hypothetical protein
MRFSFSSRDIPLRPHWIQAGASDHLPASSTDVKNAWIFTYTPPVTESQESSFCGAHNDQVTGWTRLVLFTAGTILTLFWCPASLLSIGYRGLFPRKDHSLYPVLRARLRGSISPLTHTPSGCLV